MLDCFVAMLLAMTQGDHHRLHPSTRPCGRLVTGRCEGAAPITRKAKEPAALRLVSSSGKRAGELWAGQHGQAARLGCLIAERGSCVLKLRSLNAYYRLLMTTRSAGPLRDRSPWRQIVPL
ncbi:MAG: hypothetical protein ACREIR_07665, partial [Geminicoccaceae bacterium]